MPESIRVPLPASRSVLRWLLVVVATLLSLSLLGQFLKYGLGHPKAKGLVPLFYVDYESNLPTWYSSLALSVAAVLLLLVFFAKRAQADRFARQWGLLSLLFFMLSADEIAMVHELPIDTWRERYELGGVLYYPWVLPGIAFVLAVGLHLWRFWWHLAPRTRLLFCLAGGVFCGGAIGVEMLSAVQADRWGEENFGYALIVTLEEACEMLGVVIFIYALLDYIERTLPGLGLEIKQD